nr:MAG TPA_asm: hypothetical protein [Bacteriophage sp.]
MVLPSRGTKKAKNENSQSCFCFGSFRNCSTNDNQITGVLQKRKE